MAKEKLLVAVIDFETDPFSFGAEIKPFAAGFYCGDFYREFWGDNCVLDLLSFLESRKESYIIYAHNGGKFDFFFFLQIGALSNPALIINGRIVKTGLLHHELRDSYAIIPIPLSAYQKDEIDYAKFTRDKREKNKDDILSYLKSDCVYLFNLVEAFVKRFGPMLTIGGTAIKELDKLHPIRRLNSGHDAEFRPYYFGGRVECFEYGEIKGDFKIIDVNSMYPDVMRNCLHPHGPGYIHIEGNDANKKFDRKTGEIKGLQGPYFIHFIGYQSGCFPTRLKSGLSFNEQYGEFFVTSHEIKMAIALGLVIIEKILSIKLSINFVSFDKFVDKFIGEKIEGKKTGNKTLEIFSKTIANSAYGKFATDPENFKEWFFLDTSDTECYRIFEKWCVKNPDAEINQNFGRFEIWSCKAEVQERAYFDVAVAASITGAARAKLLHAVHNVKRPIYCDTDSLICEDALDLPLHASELGAWKNEGTADTLYIAGKKLYACLSIGETVKLASKGARLDADQIRQLCHGDSIVWQSQAPNFKFDGSTKYVERKIRRRF